MTAAQTLIRPATKDDLPAILGIYNQAVRDTTAIWHEVERDLADREAWFGAQHGVGNPILVAVSGDTVLGYGSYVQFRPFDGYSKTVENSLYVSPDHQGHGAGSLILEALIDHAAKADKHIMVAAIDGTNAGSIRLHERYGFVETARMPEVGHKWGGYRDLVMLQKTL